MNYGISVLFRAIPFIMALFCFGYGALIFFSGNDMARLTAGPVVFFLGSICMALYATASTIIRQLIHTYSTFARYFLPAMGYTLAAATMVIGMFMAHGQYSSVYFVPGNVIFGLGLITACVSTAATVSSRFYLIPKNSARPDHEIDREGYTSQQELAFEALTAFFALVAWGASIALLSQGSSKAHFVAGSVMGGIACICTSLISLVASIVRQERNTYTEKEKGRWTSLVITMGLLAVFWGLAVIFFEFGEEVDFVGFILIGLGLVCFSISSKIILLAKVWKGSYALSSRIPIIPILTALTCLFLASFLFEEALFAPKFFVAARVIAGLGAICFTLFSIVSILESGTSGKKE